MASLHREAIRHSSDRVAAPKLGAEVASAKRALGHVAVQHSFAVAGIGGEVVARGEHADLVDVVHYWFSFSGARSAAGLRRII